MDNVAHAVTVTNSTNAFREVTRDGKVWLVVKGVAIVEGVLNNSFVAMEQFGAFLNDWNGVPVVIRHPQQNGGTAKTPHPDVPLVGYFYNAQLDTQGRKMFGEFWIERDRLIAAPDGLAIFNDLKAGKALEVSTGYFASKIEQRGNFNGRNYVNVQTNVHPDHIAILPDQKGACSLMDGCGINRNSADPATVHSCDGCSAKKVSADKIAVLVGEDVPDAAKVIFENVYRAGVIANKKSAHAELDAWKAVYASGWDKTSDRWIKRDYAIYRNDDAEGMAEPNDSPAEDAAESAMLAFMVPDAVKAAIKQAFPAIDDKTLASLHVTLAFLGDAGMVDGVAALKSLFQFSEYQPPVIGEVSGIARFVSGGDMDAIVALVDSPQMPAVYRRVNDSLDQNRVIRANDHGYVPHITLAYIGKNDDMPIMTIPAIDVTFTTASYVNGSDVVTVDLSGWTYTANSKFGGQLQLHAGTMPADANISQGEKQMDIKAVLNALGIKSAEALAALNDSPVPAAPATPVLPADLVELQKVVNAFGGPNGLQSTLDSLKSVPDAITNLTKVISEMQANMQGAVSLAQNAAEADKVKRAALIANVKASALNQLTDADLDAMSTSALERISNSLRPVNYSALGAAITNADEQPLAMPSFVAKKEVTS